MSEGDLELAITALAAGGDGVGRDETGRVTFVPRTAVGDRVRVRLTEAKKKFARGEVTAVIEASPDRVDPPCPFFKAGCGGCQWQHVTRAAQLAAKQKIVEDALRKITGLVVEKIADPAPPYGWRRRARFHVEGGVVGLYKLDSNDVLAIDRCPQLEPKLDDALRTAIAAKPPDGELALLLGLRGHVVMAVLGERNAVAAVGPHGQSEEVIEIEPGLHGRAQDFAQASAAGNARLIEITRSALGTGPGKLLELYAGAGNFTRGFVADRWDVIASDVTPPARHIEGLKFMVGSAAKILERVKDKVSAIVLDPPRTGAPDAIAGILRHKPRVIVYVSCDPATLARDAEQLVAGGYRAERAWPVDMMPQTSHVEVVMKLARA